jgi:aminocarboxymuconate-semialdehyde decarboxylase
MIIDVFSHIVPKNYQAGLLKKAKAGTNFSELSNWVLRPGAIREIDVRLRLMNRYPDVLQVLTIATPPLDLVVSPANAVELSKIANDEMAELVLKYPDKFVAAVACLPLNDIDAALKETDRAIKELGFKGIQIFSSIAGQNLGEPKFRPLFEKMAQYDLPIWIHPFLNPKSAAAGDINVNPIKGLGWNYETTAAMGALVQAGIFDDYPNIKFITHHCGGMVPFFEKRIGMAGTIRKIEHFKKFYNDTALYGHTSALMCGYEFFGADHILFGTDVPLGSGGTLGTLESVERMDIPDADKKKILYYNAKDLLKLII